MIIGNRLFCVKVNIGDVRAKIAFKILTIPIEKAINSVITQVQSSKVQKFTVGE